MSRQQIYNFSILLLFISLQFVEVKAQFKADFVADTVRFCPPYSVKFTDKSSGRITSRRWDFGQGGTATGNNPFPTASYIRSGTYDVKLVISDGTRTDSITKKAYIKVHRVPIPDFSALTTTKGCRPLTVSFGDNTILGDAPIKAYDWNFGDGNKSSQFNPKNKYISDGRFSVSYTVIDTNGCSSTLKKKQLIHALPAPIIKVSTSTPRHDCQPPHLVQFVNNTKGLNPISYRWNFGNGRTSTQKNPSNSYGSGVFNVQVIATDSAGCKDTLNLNRYVTVGTAKANFKVNVDTFCLSDTMSAKFTNLSVGGSTYHWDFGDGTTSTLKHPTHNYTKTGTFTVKLSISSGPNCNDAITKTVEVIQPKIDFTTNINYWCNDTNVIFYPKSTHSDAISKVRWRFMYDDPAIPIDSVGYKPITINKYETGWHYDTLVVYYKKWGLCRDSIVKKSVRIWKPQGALHITEFEGCAPLTTTITDNLMPRDSLKQGTWHFNGTTSGGRTFTRTFTQPGKYHVNFVIQHVKGCVYRIPKLIKVGAKPNADWKIKKREYCARELVRFQNLSTDSSKIDFYLWNLNLKNADLRFNRHEHRSYSDTGYKSISLIVGYHGCRDTLIRKNYIKILGPTGSFNTIIDCDKPYERKFGPQDWVDVQRFKYDFGDFFGVDSINDTTGYTYASRGNYDMKLLLYNDSNGCVSIVKRAIKVREIQLRTSMTPKRACFPEDFEILNSGSQDVRFGRTIVWGKDSIHVNAPPYTPAIDKLHSLFKGAQWPMIIGYDVNGCPDTNIHWVKTYLPTMNIQTSVDSGCGPLNVQFYDSSKYDTTVAYRSWFMAYQGLEKQVHPRKVFGKPGRHKVLLKVVDAVGCAGNQEKTIYVIKPLADIVVDTQICVGEPVIFSNPHLANKEQLSWDFDDNLIGTGDSVKITYSKGGLKSIQLRVTDSLGCDSVVNKPNWVDVQEVQTPKLVTDPPDTNCYPVEVKFSDVGTDPNVVARYWRFNAGDAYSKTRGRHTFNTFIEPGKYGVDMKIETTYGCVDSFKLKDVLNISGPYARFTLPDTICKDANTQIRITNEKNVYRYIWDFGDGSSDTLSESERVASHAYLDTGMVPVYLIISDSSYDCVKSWSDTTYVQGVSAKISINDTVGCVPFVLKATARKEAVDKYYWYVDGVKLDSAQSLSTLFKEPGQHTLKVQPQNTNTGCVGSDTTLFTVYPLPVLKQYGGGLYCYKDSAKAFVTGAKTYSWSPTQFLSTSTGDTVFAKPDSNISYTITGTSIHGCKNTINLDYVVIKPPYINEMKDTTLYAGQMIQYAQPNKYGWNYTWTPSLFLSCTSCPNPTIEANRDITYNLNIKDKYGCFSVDTNLIIKVKDEYTLLIPNAFTPNSDGLNETFKFFSAGIEEMKFFGIYDRWGNLVYQFKHLNDEWDGTSLNGTPWQTNSKFVYRGAFIRYNGEPVNVSGFIVLLR